MRQYVLVEHHESQNQDVRRPNTLPLWPNERSAERGVVTLWAPTLLLDSVPATFTLQLPLHLNTLLHSAACISNGMPPPQTSKPGLSDRYFEEELSIDYVNHAYVLCSISKNLPRIYHLITLLFCSVAI